MKKPRVLVLGSSGMLGWVVHKWLARSPGLDVVASKRDRSLAQASDVLFDAETPSVEIDLTPFDYVINCIGIIKPYCKDDDPVGVQRAIQVNARFPWLLARRAESAGAKVIQIATDCVYSGAKGAYTETDAHDALDVYGKTKSLGEVFSSPNFLNIRCSIIGPELRGKLSLLEWFLAQPADAKLKGFTHHAWNGVTTLQFGQLCERVMLEPDLFQRLHAIRHTHHFVPNNTVNKFELLNIMAKVYGRTPSIEAVGDVGPKVDRTLGSNFAELKKVFPSSTIEEALKEIRTFATD